MVGLVASTVGDRAKIAKGICVFQQLGVSSFGQNCGQFISGMTKSVIVIGAGIAGLSSAVHLAQEGYAVTVIETHAEYGLETSYMNGALVCPSLTQPWSSPSNLKSFFTETLFNRSSSPSIG